MMATPPGTRDKVRRLSGNQGPQQTVIPVDYWKQARQFKPDRYDPNRWFKAAKRAGFDYADGRLTIHTPGCVQSNLGEVICIQWS